MSSPPPLIPQANLSAESLAELKTARTAMKKIRRAVLSARIEGYCIAIFGALSFPFTLGSFWQMLVTVLLTAIGIVEINGAGKLARLDVRGTRLLTFNQLSLAVLILLYALWNIYSQLADPNAALAGMSPSDVQSLNQIGVTGMLDMTRQIMLIVYSSLIVAALIEAAMALYYHTRAPYVRQFIAQTPEWIVTMQKNGVSI
jgi:hypothetical protein